MGTVCYMEGGTRGCGTLQMERKLFGNANLMFYWLIHQSSNYITKSTRHISNAPVIIIVSTGGLLCWQAVLEL